MCAAGSPRGRGLHVGLVHGGAAASPWAAFCAVSRLLPRNGGAAPLAAPSPGHGVLPGRLPASGGHDGHHFARRDPPAPGPAPRPPVCGARPLPLSRPGQTEGVGIALWTSPAEGKSLPKLELWEEAALLEQRLLGRWKHSALWKRFVLGSQLRTSGVVSSKYSHANEV